MKSTTVLAAAAGLLLPVASAAPNSESLSRVTRRSASGSGPMGLVTVDDSHRFSPATAMKISSAPSTPESSTSQFVGECLEPTKAKYSDCVAAIGDVHGYPGNISVAANLCHNWWEGNCIVKVCSVAGSPYTGKAEQIANTIESTLLDPCLKAQGKSGVDADCTEINSQCGTYRFWLQEYTGEYDWAL
ncbi:hypothetical protein PG990_005141 [Apiospora arundinis]